MRSLQRRVRQSLAAWAAAAGGRGRAPPAGLPVVVVFATHSSQLCSRGWRKPGNALNPSILHQHAICAPALPPPQPLPQRASPWSPPLLTPSEPRHSAPPLPADWDARQEDPANQRLWEQDWDDDNTNDDFSQRLKAELAKQAAAAAPK